MRSDHELYLVRFAHDRKTFVCGNKPAASGNAQLERAFEQALFGGTTPCSAPLVVLMMSAEVADVDAVTTMLAFGGRGASG